MRRRRGPRGLSWGAAPLLVGLLVGFPSSTRAGDWPRYRGPDGAAVSEQRGLPVTWTPDDYAWNVELPGVGHSSPVICGDQLFITSAIDEGSVRYLFCLDAVTGERLWCRATGLNRSHKHVKGSWASSTPAVDGERVYVTFADEENYLVTAYDLAGGLVWRRNLGAFESQHGHGVSPIVYHGLVIVPNDQKGPSSIVALDAETGETVWSTLREIGRTSYATPIVVESEGTGPQLICCSGAMGITSLDPASGRLNWKTGPFPDPSRTVSSPVLADGLVVQTCGGGGRGNVLIAADVSRPGDSSRDRIRYRRGRRELLPYVPTPVYYDDHLFLWTDQGVVICIDWRTREDVWTERVGGNFSGSPVCIDGKLYAISEDGDVVVVAASPTYEFLGRTPLGDPSHATPAVADGRLYLRTFHRLACLEAGD